MMMGVSEFWQGVRGVMIIVAWLSIRCQTASSKKPKWWCRRR